MEIKLTKEKTDKGDIIYKIWKDHSLVDCYIELGSDEKNSEGKTKMQLQAEECYSQVLQTAKEELSTPIILLSETI